MLTLKAPAKLNLTLEVLSKRPDGFHEVRSVLQAIDLCDTLTFTAAPGISFECDMPDWSADKSLVSRAVSVLREAAGYSGGAKIKIAKRIPLMSGLAGDSTDAATVLRGLNELWGLSLPAEKLLELAATLGSDVPFFLRGGTALAAGRGEIIIPLPPLAPVWVVLVVPDVPVAPGKTGRLYAALKKSYFTEGSTTRKLVEALHKNNKLAPSLLFNTFENVAFDSFPGLSVYKDHLVKLGAPYVHLAGAGPALFTLFDDKSDAGDLHTRCRDQGMKAYLVSTL